ncbi:hypothetical protein LWC34_48640 [Kibdelosporangium philippinense]|uniref:Uncharacterized protein n=1 Tax=Kibdelosporangium philippinense TaxID=211113 RepID=A0ABS8ZSF9_9PSEU|nr:hypothetical protein [Kibdelosporangium philippinense]MCE7010622.1 hypothetical protein [Kibdelosporangium philippinense]
MSPSDAQPVGVPEAAERQPGLLGSGGCLIAGLGGLAVALLANAGFLYLIRSCHDTDAGTDFALGYSWVFVVPVLWIAASALLSVVCFVAGRIASSGPMRIATVVLGAIVLIGPLVWWYWSFGVTGASTGLSSASCPGGAPAWWPSWLPLYSP